MSDTCSACQFCTYEDGRPPEAVCHNEQSQNFGKVLSHDDIHKPGCSDFSPHIYMDLSLKEALDIITTGTKGFVPFSILPKKENRSYLIVLFENNKKMEEWRDAHVKLFFEYMKMAERDGDFKNEPD